jgi:hypothetical protein
MVFIFGERMQQQTDVGLSAEKQPNYFYFYF